TGLAAELAYLGLNWNDILDDDTATLAHAAVQLVCFAAYVVGLGRALLSVRRPSWRLPALTDRVAQCLRPFPWWLGAAALAFGLFDRAIRTVVTSLPGTVAARGLFALVVSGLIGMALMRMHRTRLASASSDAEPQHRPVWVGI